MSATDSNPEYGQLVKNVEPMRDYQGYVGTLAANTNTTIPTLIGEALQATVCGLEISNVSANTVYYQCNGAAADATFSVVFSWASWLATGGAGLAATGAAAATVVTVPPKARMNVFALFSQRLCFGSRASLT